MVAGDFAALDRALGEDVRQGVRRYRTLNSVVSAARAYGCAGVVTGA